jgi:hypothetical protein
MPRRNRNVDLLRLILVMVAVFPMLFAAPARAESGEQNVSEFHEALGAYGRWIEHPRWGLVWLPAVKDPDWRPYWRGQWVFTDDHGWLWVSDEEWGWATYHYGRWALDDDAGWLWIPGTEWAPAWVAWRFSDDHVGWAPLPPEAEWRPERGELSFDIEYYRAPRFAPVWCFVHPRFMTRPGVHRYIAPRTRNIHLVSRTRPVIDYTLVEQRILNKGVDVRLVERATRRPITPVKLRESETPREHGLRRGDHPVVSVYRPKLTRQPAAPGRARVISPADGPAAGGAPGPNVVRLPGALPDGQAPPLPGLPSVARPPRLREPVARPGGSPPTDPRHVKGRVAAPPLAPPTPPPDGPPPSPLPEKGRSRGPAPHSPGLRSFSKGIPPQPPPGAAMKPGGASLIPPEVRPRPRVPFEDSGKSGPAPHSPRWQPPPRMAAPPPGPAARALRREGGPPPSAARHGEGRRLQSEGQYRGAGAPGKRRDRDEQWPKR